MSKAVAFIGRPKHLELRLADDAEFAAVVEEVREKWREGGRFFEGSPRIRVVGPLCEDERKELCTLLVEDFGIPEVEFIGSLRSDRARAGATKGKPPVRRMPNFEFRENNRVNGNTVRSLERAAPQQRDDWQFEPLELHSEVMNVRESNALFVLETVRNGQRVAYDGDIVVLGDANAGSELVATGSIVVLGTLRGMAHAGSAGDESASVSAFRLVPQQLRIGAQMAIAPDDATEMGYAEVATVRRGEIVIMPASHVRSAKTKMKYDKTIIFDK